MKKVMYLKIILVLLVIGFVVPRFSSYLFLADSPQIRPEVITLFQDTTYRLAHAGAEKPKQPYYNAQDALAKLNNEVKDKSLKVISKGVYAKTGNNGTVYEINLNEKEYYEHVYIVNGKEIKIRIPKGEEAPTQQQIDEINVSIEKHNVNK
jgi:hypothetical protein